MSYPLNDEPMFPRNERNRIEKTGKYFYAGDGIGMMKI